VKAKVFPKHSRQLSFLSRIYDTSDGTSVPDMERIFKKVHTTGLPIRISNPAVALLKFGALLYSDGNTDFIGDVAFAVVGQIDPTLKAYILRHAAQKPTLIPSPQYLGAVATIRRTLFGAPRTPIPTVNFRESHHSRTAVAGVILAHVANAAICTGQRENFDAAAAVGYNTFASIKDSVQPRPAEWASEYVEEHFEPEEIFAMMSWAADVSNNLAAWDKPPTLRVAVVAPCPLPVGAYTNDGDYIEPADGAALAPEVPPETVDQMKIAISAIINGPVLFPDENTLLKPPAPPMVVVLPDVGSAEAEATRLPIPSQLDTLRAHPNWSNCAPAKALQANGKNFAPKYMVRLAENGPLELARWAALFHTQGAIVASAGRIPWKQADIDRWHKETDNDPALRARYVKISHLIYPQVKKEDRIQQAGQPARQPKRATKEKAPRRATATAPASAHSANKSAGTVSEPATTSAQHATPDSPSGQVAKRARDPAPLPGAGGVRTTATKFFPTKNTRSTAKSDAPKDPKTDGAPQGTTPSCGTMAEVMDPPSRTAPKPTPKAVKKGRKEKSRAQATYERLRASFHDAGHGVD